MAKRESHHEHFIHFDVAGFTYYDGCMAIGELRPGMQLMLERDTDNTHDAQAIAIYFGDKKLGYVPSNMNATLAHLRQMLTPSISSRSSSILSARPNLIALSQSVRQRLSRSVNQNLTSY